MTFEIIIVLLALIGMLAALIMDKMRPGMILFSVVVLFLCTGILSPKEMLEGFSNKGMITVALLFLVSEGTEQYPGSGYLCSHHQAMGELCQASGNLLPHPLVVCHDSGRYLYPDRHIHQPGGS